MKIFQSILFKIVSIIPLVLYFHVNSQGISQAVSQNGHFADISELAFSPDGNILASASRDYTIRIWNIRAGKLIHILRGHTSVVSGVTFSPGGQILASSSWDHTIKLWEIKTGKLLNNLKGHSASVYDVAFSPDGKILASCGSCVTINLYDIPRRSNKHAIKLWSLEADIANALKSSASDAHVTAFSPSSGMDDNSLEVHTIAFSPDARTLASDDNNNNIKLWDLKTGKLKNILQGHTAYISEVVFSPDGNLLASSSRDHTIKLWQVESGKLVRSLSRHIAYVSGVTFSPDGKDLASSSGDYTIKLWHVESGKLMNTLRGRSFYFSNIAFSPDGKSLVSGSGDASIKFWRVTDGNLFKTITGPVNEGYVFPYGKNYHCAAWRIRNVKNTFDNLSTTYVIHRTKVNVYTPKIPPELKLVKKITRTSNNYIDLTVQYTSKSNLFTIFVLHNDQDIKVTIPPNTNNARINIPLHLYTYDNSILITAINTDKQTSYLKTNIIYTEGSNKTQPIPEYIFPRGIPPWILEAEELNINGQTVKILGKDKKHNTIQFLGAQFIDGLNNLSSAGKKISNSFWQENRKLFEYPQPYKNSFAIIAAIDDYNRNEDLKKRKPTGYKQLSNMKEHAELLAQSLQKFGFPENNIITLYDSNATSQALNDSLKLFWHGGKYAYADRLFFYFGGHGDTLNKDIPYLITYDFQDTYPLHTSFQMRDLITSHSFNISAHHILFVLDACHSGLALFKPMSMDEGDRVKLKQPIPFPHIKRDTEFKARNLLLAGTDEQRALWVTGGIFTKALIDALTMHGDYNKDGILGFDELVIYVRDEVTKYAGQFGVRQHPTSYVLYGKGRCVFIPQE